MSREGEGVEGEDVGRWRREKEKEEKEEGEDGGCRTAFKGTT